MPRTSRPITVTLGDLQEHVEARVKSGAYASASEVIRAAVRALDREEAAVDGWLRQRVEEALADPRPDVPVGKVFKHLRAHHAKQVKAARRDREPDITQDWPLVEEALTRIAQALAEKRPVSSQRLRTMAELTPAEREDIARAVNSNQKSFQRVAAQYRVSEKTVGAVLESARVITSFQQSIDARMSKGKLKAATNRKRATNRAPDLPLSPEIGKKEP